MQESGKDITSSVVQRLCSEIKLFDLCTLEQCSFKIGRFCSNKETLAHFEAISEEDGRIAGPYMAEELEDGEDDSCEEGYDGECDGDEYEDDGWEEE